MLTKTAVLCLCAFFALGTPARPQDAEDSSTAIFKTLLNFDNTDGRYPYLMSLVQGFDGNFYGTTYEGGAHGAAGTVFKITPGGTLTTLHSFDGTDGEYPYAGLVQATNGNFYGTTYEGPYNGSGGYGTVFEITASGKFTSLHSFDSTDGAYPYGRLVQGTNGNFYGTTYEGGAYGYGTVFEITAGGTLTTLHSFCAKTSSNGTCTDGNYPYAGLVQGTDGNFYGTTFEGGANGNGTVYKITPGGTLTTLHSFSYDHTDGYWTYAGLVQAANGNFYGTNAAGGAHGGGTVFEITPAGSLTTLYNFEDDVSPYATLIQATDGNLYGTTKFGGANNDGMVFKISTGGTFTTLHSFDGTDGQDPYGGLLQATNGDLYGTTYFGGADSDGTVFSLSVGLGPFVETLPTSGAAGTAVTVLGNDLTGTTSVSFNGTAATFKVVSSTEITTTVPSGATTGKVEVKTPSGTLSSNVAFRVP